jgi:hypothetical protein
MTGSCYRVLVDRMNRSAQLRKNKMKTVKLEFVPTSGKNLCYRGGVRVNVKDGESMVRVVKYRGYRKSVEVYAGGLENLSFVKADDKIVWAL